MKSLFHTRKAMKRVMRTIKKFIPLLKMAGGFLSLYAAYSFFMLCSKYISSINTRL